MFSNPPAIAGFLAGLFGTVILGVTVGVLFHGQGLSDHGNPPASEIVYPNL